MLELLVKMLFDKVNVFILFLYNESVMISS